MTSLPENRAKIALTCLFLFCSALFLSAYSAKKPALSSWGVILVGESLRPLQMIFKGTSGSLVGFWDQYIGLVHLRHDYDALLQRHRALETENSRLLEAGEESKRLRALLDVADKQGFDGVAADIVGYDPSNWSQSFTVNRGSNDGIKKGMAAIEGNGAVGQVIAVSPNSARILLITDRTSGVDAIVQSSRARGIVEGDGHNRCALRYIAQDEEVSAGDRVITSGMDGIYPKGLLVGVVSEISRKGAGMFQTISVKPSVVFSRLETVLIIIGSNPAAPAAEDAGNEPGHNGASRRER